MQIYKLLLFGLHFLFFFHTITNDCCLIINPNKKAPSGELKCFSSFEKIEMYNQNHTLDKLSYSFVQQKGKKIIFLQKR